MRSYAEGMFPYEDIMAKFKIKQNEDGTTRVTATGMRGGKRVGGSESTAKVKDGSQEWMAQLQTCVQNVYSIVKGGED